jgi:hypothetical protein
MIGGKLAACMGDIVMEPKALLPLPPPNMIVQGEPTVLIGQGPAVPKPISPDGCIPCQMAKGK